LEGHPNPEGWIRDHEGCVQRCELAGTSVRGAIGRCDIYALRYEKVDQLNEPYFDQLEQKRHLPISVDLHGNIGTRGCGPIKIDPSFYQAKDRCAGLLIHDELSEII
jgi:hypothetical protein